MSIFQGRLDGFSQKYISLYLYLGLFFENGKNSDLTLDQNDDLVTQTWKMTQMTHWPGDPITQFHVWYPPRSITSDLQVTEALSHETEGRPRIWASRPRWDWGAEPRDRGETKALLILAEVRLRLGIRMPLGSFKTEAPRPSHIP